jgi:hypothetical protein
MNELLQPGAWSAQTSFAPEPSGAIGLDLQADPPRFL